MSASLFPGLRLLNQQRDIDGDEFCLLRGFLLSMGVMLSVVAAVFMVLSPLRLLLLSMPLRQES